ncbi:hypothetical protein R3W88_022526 [Solanum pinnatisectum]|uniref:Uncharacterized protein n=1 Tax=Solanum pinnatisectum TaxID=50273 RepID=A0AAV9LVT9_9SOLN|nr:hypothetical protein R3W88_022526 [Solanum pinnatisectum]
MTSLKVLNMASGENNGTLLIKVPYFSLFVLMPAFSEYRVLTSLEYLDIAANKFDVPLSFNQFSNHTKLINLDVGYNTIIPDTEFQNWIPNFQLEFFGIEECIKLQKLPSFLHYQYDLK